MFNNAKEIFEKKFKLSTTSYVVPDYIVENVKIIGSFFDEIEILVFESRQNVLPTKKEIKDLLKLSQDLNVGYNVHLPIDISINSDNIRKRNQAQNTIEKILELFAVLNPSTHTLHLEMPLYNRKNDDTIKQWYNITHESLTSLQSRLVSLKKISFETLDYPFAFIEPFVSEFDLEICIDLGHHIKYGYDFQKVFANNKSRTPIIHLHGVEKQKNLLKDHLSIDKLKKEVLEKIMIMLNNYTGIVSIEVFNFENLQNSLKTLSRTFKEINPKKLKNDSC